jgi:hypothetical protein
MKMLIITGACLVIVLMGSSYVNSDTKGSSTYFPKARLTESLGEFWFPVDDADGVWRRNVFPSGTVDYWWAVEMEFCEQTFQIWVSHACHKPADVDGTLEELLAECQVRIAKLNTELPEYRDGEGEYEGAWFITDQNLEVGRKDDGILLRITNSGWIQTMISARPETVVFESRTPSGPKVRYSVKIQYDGNIAAESSSN